MPRLFLPGFRLAPGPVTIRDEKARYLTTVLRCSRGDIVTLHDDEGNAFTAQIAGVSKKEVLADVREKIDFHSESPLHVTLFQGILKGDKMDLVIQKATELGVNEITPVVTERCQIRQTRKQARWQKIAEEASRQSGRNSIPAVHSPVDIRSLLGTIRLSGSGIIFWEEGGVSLSKALKEQRSGDRISLFTGPEGGFTEKEVEAASGNGFITATLGRRILRAETAAIAAISVVQFVLGDFGS